MALSREQIVQELKALVGAEKVITDEQVLKDSSIDRFRKFQDVSGVYVLPIPAAVVMASSTQEIADVLKFANKNKINIVPRTGRSGIEGGLETAVENSVVLDASNMNKVLDIDTYNMQLTCQCGVPLQDIDDKLREMGYHTGHSPQSKPLAQMGGLVAVRSIGQFSTLYGGIEDLIVGMEAVFPDGRIARIKNVPRRAAGPDIRHVIVGNEGALCYITEVTVKIFKYRPENNRFMGFVMDNMDVGFTILREVMVEGYRPSVARLYDLEDAQYYFSHFAKDKCVLLFMAEGPTAIAKATEEGILDIVSKHSECKAVDPKLIETWFLNLNWGPEKIAEELKEIAQTHNIGYTTEVSGSWSNIHDIYENTRNRIINEIPDITMMGGHSSHSYINGTNMYFMYYYNIVDVAPEDEINKYHNPINKIICEETLRFGGSIVHHHGIGKARVPWVKDEFGSSYFILEELKKAFDPNGIMNAGTLLPMEK